MFKYLKGTNNVPKYEVNTPVRPAKTGFVTFVRNSLLNWGMDNLLQAIIGVIATVGILIWYYYSDWKDPYDRYVTKEQFKDRLLPLLFIGLLMWPVSCIINFFD